jgi:hypothetical protein
MLYPQPFPPRQLAERQALHAVERAASRPHSPCVSTLLRTCSSQNSYGP